MNEKKDKLKHPFKNKNENATFVYSISIFLYVTEESKFVYTSMKYDHLARLHTVLTSHWMADYIIYESINGRDDE